MKILPPPKILLIQAEKSGALATRQGPAQHPPYGPRLLETQCDRQGHDGAGVTGAKPRQVLLRRRQKRASLAGFPDQRLDLARGVRMVVSEIVRGDDLRPDPAQGGVEFLRSRNAGEGDDLPSDQGRRGERVAARGSRE